MKKFNSKFKDLAYFAYRWIMPQGDSFSLLKSITRYPGYFNDIIKYSRMKGAEKIKLIDTYPCIHDKTNTTPFDPQYFYQNIWCFKKVYNSRVSHHVDVGSSHVFVGLLTAVTKVIFIDIRPLNVNLENLESKKGTILLMPFPDNSIQSLSCLHVAEHIGLGRYGDPLDPMGTKKAAKELSRVLAADGNLYFSLPIGKPRLCFNAHRIHSPQQILDYFNDLKLMKFSGVDDDGRFLDDIDVSDLKDSSYACGLFWFKK